MNRSIELHGTFAAKKLQVLALVLFRSLRDKKTITALLKKNFCSYGQNFGSSDESGRIPKNSIPTIDIFTIMQLEEERVNLLTTVQFNLLVQDQRALVADKSLADCENQCIINDEDKNKKKKEKLKKKQKQTNHCMTLLTK